MKNNKSEALVSTFSSWEDERTEEEIIKEIYESRNSNLILNFLFYPITCKS